MLLDGLSRDAVLAAIREFDEIGRDRFLERYGYGSARDYVLVHEGKRYDSKAIAGVAYGYDHSDEGPLTPDQFVGGRATVVRVLESLGFEMDDTSVAREPAQERVWVIRAGRGGEQESLALDQSVALIGWSTLGELSTELSRDELKERIQAEYGERRPQSLASQAGQIYRFVNEVSIGDLVVLPLRTSPNHVAVGRVASHYRYREDGPFFDSDGRHTHDVEWLGRSIPSERFDPDLRDAFGQQGTVSEVTKDAAAKRILEVALEGADASAIHLVLKWSPTLEANTIELHRQVAEQHGAVWWGRVSKPGTTGLAADRLRKFEEQIDRGSLTNIYLHSAAATWRTRLLAITTNDDDLDESLIPSYYEPETHHSLWVKITDFEETDPAELTEGFVLAQSGEPVTLGALGNQTPLIIRKQSATLPARYFILNQASAGGGYDDEEGFAYHWTERSSGAWKQLANSPGANFVYYRPGQAADGTGQTYFGAGQIASIAREKREDGLQHFVARIEDFSTFDTPVPWKQGPNRNAQTSIQPITRVQYEKLLAQGMTDNRAITFDVESIRAAAEERGLILADDIYTQLVAALNSGKHVILTGPPGTAKTTLAQVAAETARDANLCSDYTLTTATADWTTFETIGGLRPTSAGELEFHEGHFLSALRQNRWLVIDELNRSNFDRAFGQLFTVLSGQPVVLPYHRPQAGTSPLTLVPAGKDPPIGDADVLEIPQGWRIVATMNVFDKTLLFEMSFALMRRFAFIEVASPSEAVFEALIDREAGGEAAPATLAKQLLQLRQLKDLGPAVYMDVARYLRERMAIDAAEDGQLLFEAFYSYLLPQFEGLDDASGEQLFGALGQLVGPNRKERLRSTLNEVLGLELQPPQSGTGSALPEPEPEVVEEEP
jgi:MoxR-like ATPase